MPSVDFDVVVVGGGCSGLWAARTAAEAGASAVLIEGRSRIGERIACGEGVGTDGIAQLVDLRPEWVAARIDGARLFMPDGDCVEIGERDCGVILNKELLLHGIAEMTAEAGVEMWLGSRARVVGVWEGGVDLEIERPGGTCTLRAKSVVAADGIESNIARQAGVHEGLRAGDMFSCAQYTVSSIDVDPNVVEFHMGRDVAPGGYAWVFPKGESTANVGVGLVVDSSGGRSPMDYLREFKRRRCPRSRVSGSIVGGVPSVRHPYKACGRGIFTVGDAAGCADPVSGAGIVLGMESAKLAGEAAGLVARGDSAAREIEKVYVKQAKALFKDRNLRYGVRAALSKMMDPELARLIRLLSEYAVDGSVIRSDPFKLVAFLVKAMPRSLGLLRHLVGV
jgi:digeranylgeranylglycerophospholipid reductase